jgi:hypothetical protein
MLNDTAFADKGGGLRVAMSGGIANAALMHVATTVRNTVLRKYRILPARHIPLTLGAEPSVIASIKYDGEGVFVYFDAERDLCVAFNAPSGKARIGLPCTEQVKQELIAQGHTSALLSAELYLKTVADQRSRVSDVIHATSNGTPEERNQLALAFYNVVMLDRKNLSRNEHEFEATWDLLAALFGTDASRAFHRVEGAVIPGAAAGAWFSDVTARGLEGMVARLPHDPAIYKIKPSLSIDCVVIGYVEGEFEGQYGVLSLLCALTGPDGKTLQAICRVGSGFTDAQRVDLLDTVGSRKITTPVNVTDSEGRPVTFIRPGLVVEVEGEELRATALNGRAALNQTFQWDGSELRFMGVAPSPKLTHPTFARIRDDKEWQDGGTRMEQVMSPAAIAAVCHPTTLTAPDPVVVLREVHVKHSKSGDPDDTCVRKILVVERNAPGRFTRFALHWTDYSRNRQVPLQTETRIAETPERLAELLDGYRATANKRGWARAT